MKKLLVAVTLSTLLLAPDAQAHVLVTDQSSQRGSILHIQPNDDPVAGEVATIFFDTQGQLLADENTGMLKITGPGNINEELELVSKESLMTVDFTFPIQGLYILEFSIIENDFVYTFIEEKRVSRGVSGERNTVQTHQWAEVSLVASGASLLVLGIVGINNRRHIKRNSKL